MSKELLAWSDGITSRLRLTATGLYTTLEASSAGLVTVIRLNGEELAVLHRAIGQHLRSLRPEVVVESVFRAYSVSLGPGELAHKVVASLEEAGYSLHPLTPEDAPPSR